MSHKNLIRALVIVPVVLALFAIPLAAGAGGVCGGSYIVEKGETVDSIAAKCGTLASHIYAANPGLTTVYAGQTIIVPGATYNGGSVVVTSVPPTYYTPVPSGYSTTYYVQYGDTFSAIAYRFGVTQNALWAANPRIANINVLYIGQLLYIPYATGLIPPSGTTQDAAPLSYGSVPANAPHGSVKLINKARADVYVSLQGTTTDGTSVIREYPVPKNVTDSIPAAWYTYVAWVGGQKFVGQFHLGGGQDATLTFQGNKVVVE
jgi:LysM repeat protein